MLINNKEIDINAITKDIFDDKDMIKNKGNGIYLSDNQINVLKRYNIDYKKYNSIKV